MEVQYMYKGNTIMLRMKERAGRKLHDERVKADITQREVARIIGINASAVSKLEGGKEHLSLYTLLKICWFFGMTLDDLYDIDEFTEMYEEMGVRK